MQAGSFSSRLQPLTGSASRDQASGWGDVLLGGEEGGGPTPRPHSLLTPLGRAHSHLRGGHGNLRSLLSPPGSGDRGACDSTPSGDPNNVKKGPQDGAPAAALT